MLRHSSRFAHASCTLPVAHPAVPSMRRSLSVLAAATAAHRPTFTLQTGRWRRHPSDLRLAPAAACTCHASRCFASAALSPAVAPGLPAPSTTPAAVANQLRLSRIRNIGIIAHIDAGKTTTTERCLFYANKIRHMGDVDHGDTTMDFMREERDRGITIQSACITLQWTRITSSPGEASSAVAQSQAQRGKKISTPAPAEPEHRINLIDTPGHVDFTQQVEQSLRVLDGAVVVLDGVKGVEAQTEMVWSQAANYGVARIVFVNKLDRDGASFEKVVDTVREKLHTTPLVLTLPCYDETRLSPGGAPLFTGLIDLLRMEVWEWGRDDLASPSAGQADTGANFSIDPLRPGHSQFPEAIRAREELIESIAEADEEIMELYLGSDESTKKPGGMHIGSEVLRKALRRIVVQLPPRAAASASSPSSPSSFPSSPTPAPPQQQYTLVICGSSKANKGVQFLLNSIVDYLPSPLDKGFIELEQFGAPPAPAATKSGGGGKGKQATSQPAAAGAAPVSRTLLKSVASDPTKDPLVALAFKVTHDLARGALPIVFCRVYTGAIKKGDTLVSVSPPNAHAEAENASAAAAASRGGKAPASGAGDKVSSPAPSTSGSVPLNALPKERPQKLLEISADNLNLEVGSIESGNIGALVGMKSTRTGDTILSATSATAAAAALHSGAASKASVLTPGAVDTRVGYLKGITFSEPVFFCSVEAGSLSLQNLLDASLACLQREDPSLVVSTDPESGQTLLKGMGELHLDIVRSRLLHDFQLAGTGDGEDGVQFGKMQISYRETLAIEKQVEGFRYTAGNLVSGPALALAEAEAVVSLKCEPLDPGSGVEIEIDPTGTVMASNPHSPSSGLLRAALEAGVRDGLARGPLLGYALTDVRVSISDITLSGAASTQALCNSLRGCAARALGNLLREAVQDSPRNVQMLEPFMRAEVQVSSTSLGDVLSDLTSKRRAQIQDVGQLSSPASQRSGAGGSGGASSSTSGARSFIHAEVPLSCMLGYATALRSTTQGQGSFSMQFVQFRAMPANLQIALVESPP